MRKSVKIAAVTAGVVIIAAAAMYIGISIFFNSRTPRIDGVFHAGGIMKKTTVIRDSWGVPHISAENGKDAYFAYGFTIAQDRLFQMELQRRLALGELSELLGPSLIKVDRMFRTYLLKHTAEQYLRHPERIHPKALELLDAYLAGVNHFIDTQKLPVEYSLLGHKPREFTRLDVLAMFGYMAYSFTDAIDTDSLNTILKEKCPDRNIRELFPGYTRETPVTIMESQPAFKQAVGDVETGVKITAVRRGVLERLVSFFKAGDAVHSRAEKLTVLEEAAGICPPFKGSNSWVIGPSRSESGRPILANDPHVALAHPGVWYEAHIRFPGFEVYGYHIPMIPFPMLGHNSIKAWAVTMFENDDLDLYAETFHPKDPALVMYRGNWTRITVLKETIKVKGQKDESFEIRITPHGPVITEFIDGYTGKPVSMWWVYHKVDNPVLDVVYGLSTAATPAEFRQAVSRLAAPGLNLSYADSKGNIAWWAAGRLPVRPAHVYSREILDGASGRDEVMGFVPFAQNPYMVNPPGGIIVTANNKSTVRPVGPIRDLEGYWVPGDRAARIIALLSSRKKWNIGELKKVQTDIQPQAAPSLIVEVSRVMEGDRSAVKKFTDIERRAFDRLKAWDFKSDVSSAGASLYHVLMYHILKEAIEDELGPEYFITYSDTSDYWNALKALIRDDTSAYWDNTATKRKEGRSDIMLKAFRNTVKELSDRFGGNVDSWQWGKMHTIEYEHPIGRKKPMNLVFNIGPLPAPGEAHHINRMKSHFGKHEYRVKSVPSTRRLVDFGNLEESWSILPAGNSGSVKSPHYGDQVEMYLNGQYRKIIFSSDQIKKNAKHTMELLPAN